MSKTLLVLAMIILSATPLLATATIGELNFATSFDSLMSQAQSSHRLMVIKFYTDW